MQAGGGWGLRGGRWVAGGWMGGVGVGADRPKFPFLRTLGDPSIGETTTEEILTYGSLVFPHIALFCTQSI